MLFQSILSNVAFWLMALSFLGAALCGIAAMFISYKPSPDRWRYKPTKPTEKGNDQ